MHNFTPTYFSEYHIKLKGFSFIQEVFNTDAEKYGGSGKVNDRPRVIYQNEYPESIVIQMAPLASMIFNVY